MSESSTTTESTGASILIVDDDPTMRRMLTEILTGAGYKVVAAADAPEALRLAYGTGCDLIVLDLEMPEFNGIALCRLLRAQHSTRQLPILALSGNSDEETKIEAFQAGVDDYIVKPSTPRELLSRIRVHLENASLTQTLVGSNRELLFLADLGRNLLRALEPEQVVKTVAAAAYDGTNAVLCAVAINLGRPDETACVFVREGSAEGLAQLYLPRLHKWARDDEGEGPKIINEAEKFLLRDEEHKIEYVAPLRFGRRTQGALIVGFDRDADCSETVRRLVDAAAQQTALAAHISSLYESAREASISFAKEEQRRFMEAIIDTLPISLYAVNRDFRIVAWNRNREIGGQGIPRDDAIGRNIFEVLTRQPREMLEMEFFRAFATGSIERIEQETVDEHGNTQHWLISKIPMRDSDSDSGTITHVITVGENITARVKANRAIARAERLASVGRLAAGVVHEINNPLATISACAEALESRAIEGAFGESPELDDLREYLALIRSEAFRCKSITNGLLDFSRQRASLPAKVDLNEVLRSAARLLSHQRRNEQVDVIVESTDEPVIVGGDEGQLQQAVIVLSTNALDAMPEGGRLTLRAGVQDSQVVIEVTDTGSGIPPENLAKIFDPFFTTKELGQGTGLGLAVCYGIVTEHGGRLDVNSTVGSGTTFTIYLPLHE
jgi:two-component system NtrC family sensor kinase